MNTWLQYCLLQKVVEKRKWNSVRKSPLLLPFLSPTTPVWSHQALLQLCRIPRLPKVRQPSLTYPSPNCPFNHMFSLCTPWVSAQGYDFRGYLRNGGKKKCKAFYFTPTGILKCVPNCKRYGWVCWSDNFEKLRELNTFLGWSNLAC